MRDDLAAGRLIAVLEDRNFGDTVVFNAVLPDPAGYLPARVRAFIDSFSEVGLD